MTFLQNTVVVADKWLSIVIDYDAHSKQYILQSYNGIKLTYQMDLHYQVAGKITIAEIGDVCHVDRNEYESEITLITTKGVTVKDPDGIIRTIEHPNPSGKTEQITIKQSNPKDAIGSSKASLSVLSGPVLYEDAIGMTEGACKYGKHNYREIGVRYSVYFDAAMRHLWAAWEGEDIDPESGCQHVTKARTTLMVLRDAQIRCKCFDDRPRGTTGFIQWANEQTAKMIEKHKDHLVEPYLGKGESDLYSSGGKID